VPQAEAGVGVQGKCPAELTAVLFHDIWLWVFYFSLERSLIVKEGVFSLVSSSLMVKTCKSVEEDGSTLSFQNLLFLLKLVSYWSNSTWLH